MLKSSNRELRIQRQKSVFPGGGSVPVTGLMIWPDNRPDLLIDHQRAGSPLSAVGSWHSLVTHPPLVNGQTTFTNPAKGIPVFFRLKK